VNTATAVAKAESSLNPAAVGDVTLQYQQDGVQYGASYGCFQIRYLQGRPAPETLLDPVQNVQYAYDMYKGQSWAPWSAYNSGAYLKHMR
jgi:hypothetical protein